MFQEAFSFLFEHSAFRPVWHREVNIPVEERTSTLPDFHLFRSSHIDKVRHVAEFLIVEEIWFVSRLLIPELLQSDSVFTELVVHVRVDLISELVFWLHLRTVLVVW